MNEMNEINSNLLKLQSEVRNINELFQKQTVNQNVNYFKMLNNPMIRFGLIFLLFYSFLFLVQPDFCVEEVVNETTFFKEKKFNYKLSFIISIILSAIIFYFSNQIQF